MYACVCMWKDLLTTVSSSYPVETSALEAESGLKLMPLCGAVIKSPVRVLVTLLVQLIGVT